MESESRSPQLNTPYASSSLDEKIAVGFARAVTRRRFFRLTLRWALVAGSVASGALTFAPRASATTCAGNFVNTWNCYCAPTQTCSGCSGGSCPGCYGPRCTYWTQVYGSGYCWCSQTCCVGGLWGHYVCCDYWQTHIDIDCSIGEGACLCRHRHVTSEC